MKTRFTVLLNDVSLDSLNDDLVITDISYPASTAEVSVAQFAGREGGYITDRRKAQTTAVISFELHVYGTRARQEACQEVISWAKNGGKLQTSDRPDQYLQCVCTKLPSVESALRWTDALTVEFTAYAVPYWQSVFPSKTALSGAEDSGVVFVPGNAKTRADVKITASAAVTQLTVGFGSSVITLTGLTAGQGDVITVSHDDNGIPSIRQGTVSILSKRTAGSADDLVDECGNIPVTVSASAPVTAEFTVKGVWN